MAHSWSLRKPRMGRLKFNRPVLPLNRPILRWKPLRLLSLVEIGVTLVLLQCSLLAEALQYFHGPKPMARGKEPVFQKTWEIVKKDYNGDCNLARPTEMVNGNIPGPIVTVHEGTRMIITFVNKQSTPMTIHWHGIKQKGSQWSDGVSGVTQCDIKQGQRMSYNFTTEGHSGTLWWHAHVGFTRHTVFGGLNVIPRKGSLRAALGRNRLPVPLQGGTTLFLSDWYESSSSDLADGILGFPYQGWPVPDTLLLNGATRQHCSPMFEFRVQRYKWYRLRVTNAALYATMNFAVQNHDLFSYEGEGGYLKVRHYHTFDIMSGQSYSFLIFTNQKPGAYYMGGRPRFETEQYGGPPALGVFRYANTPPKALPRGHNGFYFGPSVTRNPWFTQGQLSRTKGATAPPDYIRKPTKLVVLELNMNNVKNDRGQIVSRYSVNNITMSPPSDFVPLRAEYDNRPSLLNPGFMPSLPPQGLEGAVNQDPSKVGFGVIDLPYGETVQMVFQNHVPPGLNHPLHLHGHQFWVVATGTGKFDSSKWKTGYKYNLKNPVERNTAWVLEGYWTAIRFKADNPGVWIMHCHLEPHVDGGMMAVFRVHKDRAIPPPPKDFPTC